MSHMCALERCRRRGRLEQFFFLSVCGNRVICLAKERKKRFNIFMMSMSLSVN